MKKTIEEMRRPELSELTEEECSAIIGGESVWFWIGNAIGSFFH